LPYLLDTSVAIPLRDHDPDVVRKLRGLRGDVTISVVTLVELEGGVHRDPADAARRQARLDAMMTGIVALPFEPADAQTYGMIVRAAGFSRRKVLDRMIAAQAILRGATLVTLNPGDFSDVANLRLLAL